MAAWFSECLVHLVYTMATYICLVFIAVFAAAHCNPIGQTVCETQAMLPKIPLLPWSPITQPSSTTVCESTPNIGMGLGFNNRQFPLNLAMLSQLLNSVIDNSLPLIGSMPTATVCESNTMPNVLPNVPSTTVCESSQSPFPNLPIVTNPQTTVCESTPNLPNFPLSILGMAGYPFLGMPNIPIPGMGLSNLPLSGYGMPNFPIPGMGLSNFPFKGIGNLGNAMPLLPALLSRIGVM